MIRAEYHAFHTIVFVNNLQVATFFCGHMADCMVMRLEVIRKLPPDEMVPALVEEFGCCVEIATHLQVMFEDMQKETLQ